MIFMIQFYLLDFAANCIQLVLLQTVDVAVEISSTYIVADNVKFTAKLKVAVITAVIDLNCFAFLAELNGFCAVSLHMYGSSTPCLLTPE